MIDHGDGYYTGFGHLSSFNVSQGQTVSRGQQIAVSGNTGISTGDHLHYEVYIGGIDNYYRVDPLQYTSHPSLIYGQIKKNRFVTVRVVFQIRTDNFVIYQESSPNFLIYNRL